MLRQQLTALGLAARRTPFGALPATAWLLRLGFERSCPFNSTALATRP